VLADDLVERGLGVQHHRPELAVARLDAGLGEQRGVHLPLLVAQLGQAK
jgi:hypothetical protein